jgi:hypothetical protein
VQVPELAPYLDLSLVQSVTYIDVKGDSFRLNCFYPDEEDFQRAKVVHRDFEGGAPFIPYRLLPDGDAAPFYHPLAVERLHLLIKNDSSTYLWPFFDPVHLCIEGSPSDDQIPARSQIYRPFDFSYLKRLRGFTSIDATPRDFPLFDLERSWFRTGPVSMTFEVSSAVSDESVSWTAQDLRGPKNGKDTTIDRVLVKVRTEEIKNAILDGIKDSPLFGRTTIVATQSDASS